MKKGFSVCAESLLALMLVAVGSGCLGTKVKFEDIPLEKADMTRGRTIESSATGFQLLCLIPISINDRLSEAYWRLKRSAGSDYLTDIQISESWAWAYIGTIHKTRLIAQAYPQKPGEGVNHEVASGSSRSLTEKLNELKTLHDNHMLSDQEYEAARAKAVEQYK